MKTILLALCATAILALTGCNTITPFLPDDYAGPTATIYDSTTTHSSSKVDFYYVEKINGQTIKNSRSATLADNYGNGFYMDPVLLHRKLPIEKVTLAIVARTEYAAPILAMTNAVYQVVGEIEFTPKEGVNYVVIGSLAEDESSVWVENAETHEVQGEKIVVEGSAKLGFWKK